MIPYFIQEMFGAVVYCALLFIYFPIFVLGYLTIQKNLFILKTKRFLRLRVTSTRLGLVSRKSRVTDVSQVSTDEEIDFQANRSLAYVYRMALWTPRELVKTLLRMQTIRLISDEHLAYVILSTVFAHSVVWDEVRQMFRLKMEGFEDLCLFQGFYWDARHVLVCPDSKKIVIQMDDGKEYHSDCSAADRADFDLAKLHVQVCLSYFAPGLSHNHVHFVFPSAVCVLSKKLLNPEGTLYKLLSPHFRFTERINYQALRVGKATNNKRSIIDRLFFPWQPFPVTKEQFLEGVARKCKKHYVDKGASACSAENDRRVDELSNDKTGDKELPSRRHQLFPPDYVTDKDMMKIPYLAFLREYYMVVRKFVEAMAPHIDKKEWDELASAVQLHVPFFDKVDMIDCITTFIHQVGVVHYCDHEAYCRYFAYEYGSMAIRTPFESFKDVEHWSEIAEELNLDRDAIKKNPLLLIRQRDVMRTRCFLNIFVDYIPNPKCNMQLCDTEYNFTKMEEKQAASDFISELHRLDKDLMAKDLPIVFESREEEKRGIGLQLIPLPDIVRSVCF